VHDLRSKIKMKKQLLATLVQEKGNLQDPEIQSLSRELDVLIVMALKTNISNKKRNLMIG